ncbi:MAG: alpha/beta hydrolase-fold protein [Bacteroidota bacterium]
MRFLLMMFLTIFFFSCSEEDMAIDNPKKTGGKAPISEEQDKPKDLPDESGERFVLAQKYFTHELSAKKIPFSYYEPMADVEKNEKYPLVLALHGAEYFLSPDTMFLKGQERTAYMALAWLEKKNQAKYPCFVVAPNLHQGLWQSGADERYFGWEKEYPADFVEKLLDSLLANNPKIDENRMYLTGHSMGGTGTWYLGTKFKEKFAALVPLSSAFSSEQDTYQFIETELSNGLLKDLPVWSFIHRVDANSKQINGTDYEDGSRALAESMSEQEGYDLVYTHRKGNVDNNLSESEILEKIEAGGKHFYTEYSYPCQSVGDCHFAQEYALQEDFLLQWLFQQKKIK